MACKKKVIFLAPYPDQNNIKEGMMQRVNAIDQFFEKEEWEKEYISISFKSIRNILKLIDQTRVYALSVFTGFIKIVKELNTADVIYIHSLYGIGICGLLLLGLLKKPQLIWDVHGIIPEELRFSGTSKVKILVYDMLEKKLAQKVNKIIVVTNQLKKFLLTKYPNIVAEFLVYPILPQITMKEYTYCDCRDLNKNEVVCIYSGNTQKYQNVNLMLDAIKFKHQKNVKYIILTGQPDIFKEYIESRCIDKHIDVLSVNTEQLKDFYLRANYGFILRDDMPINTVACPTKMTEYLAYGIIPIVLTENIGDFNDYGYDRLLIDDFKSDGLESLKSEKNVEIFKRLKETYSKEYFLSFVNAK